MIPWSWMSLSRIVKMQLYLIRCKIRSKLFSTNLFEVIPFSSFEILVYLLTVLNKVVAQYYILLSLEFHLKPVVHLLPILAFRCICHLMLTNVLDLCLAVLLAVRWTWMDLISAVWVKFITLWQNLLLTL